MEAPTRSRTGSNLCDIQNNLGITLQRIGKYEAAEAAHREALAILEVLVRDRPARSDHQYNLSNTHNNLGTLYQLTGRHDQAEASYRLAAEILQVLTRDHPDVLDYGLDLGACELNLGRNENDRYRSEAALDWLDKAILKLEEAYRREPRAGITARFSLQRLCRPGRGAGPIGPIRQGPRRLGQGACVRTQQEARLERARTRLHARPHRPSRGGHRRGRVGRPPIASSARDPEVWFQLARLYSACSAAERSVAGPADKDRLDQADEYAARAGEFLRAVPSGRLLRESHPHQGPAGARPHARSSPLAAGVSGPGP